MKKLIIILSFLSYFQSFSLSDYLVGCWVGKIDVLQQELAIKICFELDSNLNISGTIDIPQQNAFKLPLSNIKTTQDSIKFDLIVNVMNIARFVGKIYYPFSDTTQIIGKFSQFGVVGKFELEKFIDYDIEDEPEEAKYQEEVEIHNGEIKLSGTFERPETENKYPAIIFITGSGFQNRDEEIFGFKIFKNLSKEFLKMGFATLRCDDRGVGGSTTTPNTSPTTFDFASDVQQMINYLKTRNDIDTNRIGLLGHSEGAIVSLIVAARSRDVKFIINLAGPTIRGDSLILEQIRIQMKNQNASDSIIQQTLKDQNELYHIIRYSKDFTRAKEILYNQAKKQMEMYPDEVSSKIPKTLIEKNVQLQVESMRSDWFTTFIDIDPLEYLKKVTCPVLYIFGEKDQQVPPRINIQRLQKLKKKNIEVKIIPQANHLFQKSKTGQMYEYAILPKRLVPELMQSIARWLRTKISK